VLPQLGPLGTESVTDGLVLVGGGVAVGAELAGDPGDRVVGVLGHAWGRSLPLSHQVATPMARIATTRVTMTPAMAPRLRTAITPKPMIGARVSTTAAAMTRCQQRALAGSGMYMSVPSGCCGWAGVSRFGLWFVP